MKTQAINMPYASQALNTRTSNGNSSFNGKCCVVPIDFEEDTFTRWVAKNVLTASIFSVAWDLGTNLVSKFKQSVDAVPAKQILKNMLVVSGVFLLVGGIFKLVSDAIDKNN